ncbi:MAG: formyltetrahydrofolate deformylase [Saprospiraceae bacterium]
MNIPKNNTAILLIHCPDQKGIVAAISDFLLKNNGNVVDIQQHVEKDINHFFMRVEWELADFVIPKAKIEEYFATLIGNKYQMQWQLYFSDKKPRMALFVSKMTHCLYDILQRYMSGEWNVEIPLIIGNHEKLKTIADRFDIPFHHFKITKATKAEQEAKEIALLREQEVDFVVLARYMQILSDDFVKEFPNQVINIHHSFLPAFIGARPYHAAHKRGVKIIGATSHYVTADLDEGPIIVQHTTNVSHRDSIKDLIRKGRNLEKMVLSEAIYLQLQHKVLTYQNRTIVF